MDKKNTQTGVNSDIKNTDRENTELSLEQIDADKIMQDFDRESNTRIFTGWKKHVITGILCLFSTYMISMALLFPTATKIFKLTSFMAFIVFIGFLIFPAYKKQTKKINYVPFYDVILAVSGAGLFLYYAIFERDIVMMINKGGIGTLQIVIALLAILLLIELVRRAVGLPIIFVAGAFIAYAAIKTYLENPDIALRHLMQSLYYDVANGIFSTPVYVCTTFIVLFIILGALLEKTGIGGFFVDLANSISGSAVGGPAKVAVISSALEGMYSGSSVANTVGSGSITIPMMKKTGYKPEFAAAVEAAASTGGQIMPPIMGAAAFLMAEITGVKYSTIALTAILPAALYFTGIFLMIHFEAKKLGLKGLPKDAIPNFFKLILKNGYLLLPIVVLVICMNFFSAGQSACFAILACFVVSLLPKDFKNAKVWQFLLPLIPVAVTLGIWLPVGRKNVAISIFIGIIACCILSFITKKYATLTPGVIIDSLSSGAKNTIGVASACGMAGLIAGVVTMTALGGLLLTTLVPIAQNSMFLALFLTMLCCIVLGMGVPTTANYVIMATITAPILINMGIPALAAHMFVFYFGIVADITPPVALAAYAGSAIAKSNPLKTGVTATRLAIAAFIIPYMFAYNPKMLFIDAGIFDIVSIVITSFIGIYAVAAGMEGYMSVKLPVWQRLLTLMGGLMLIIPETITDIAGISIVMIVVFLQKAAEKQKISKTLKVIVPTVIAAIAVSLILIITFTASINGEWKISSKDTEGYPTTITINKDNTFITNKETNDEEDGIFAISDKLITFSYSETDFRNYEFTVLGNYLILKPVELTVSDETLTDVAKTSEEDTSEENITDDTTVDSAADSTTEATETTAESTSEETTADSAESTDIAETTDNTTEADESITESSSNEKSYIIYKRVS